MSTQEPPMMGEGRNPHEELKGWANKANWKPDEISDAPAKAPHMTRPNPKCSITNEPLIEVGRTAKKNNPIYLSKADDVPEDNKDGIIGGALYLWQQNNPPEVLE